MIGLTAVDLNGVFDARGWGRFWLPLGLNLVSPLELA